MKGSRRRFSPPLVIRTLRDELVQRAELLDTASSIWSGFFPVSQLTSEPDAIFNSSEEGLPQREAMTSQIVLKYPPHLTMALKRNTGRSERPIGVGSRARRLSQPVSEETGLQCRERRATREGIEEHAVLWRRCGKGQRREHYGLDRLQDRLLG